ncbi:MAG: MogA/MoaB family molybdenum cofactor biosynthesis protein [Desulfovibrio sp.]|nr:MogA/MoaB family molybdenum cofactor biosynthesis protein [Desulfovibrio sp.]
MNVTVTSNGREKGSVEPLLPPNVGGNFAADLTLAPETFPVGSTLEASGAPFFQIIAYDWLPPPTPPSRVSLFAPILRALKDVPAGSLSYSSRKVGWSLAVITLSDKGSRGEREDLAGPLVAMLVADALPLAIVRHFLIPDEPSMLKSLLARLALAERYNLILTSGGTGLSERDIAPETTLSLLDKTLPGFSTAMTVASLKSTPRAIISRAAAGAIDRSLVVNLPGSAKGAEENLAAILPALDHALAKLNGDNADCGA